jgi:hypothetical protein
MKSQKVSEQIGAKSNMSLGKSRIGIGEVATEDIPSLIASMSAGTAMMIPNRGNVGMGMARRLMEIAERSFKK